MWPDPAPGSSAATARREGRGRGRRWKRSTAAVNGEEGERRHWQKRSRRRSDAEKRR
ncbi:hypothetical protein DAI22_05g113401 [Oryza sativa Japonica Group]|nr:hypothetical protein DAI22_05g113401 [Oryza sativa Japonica Group]